MKTICYSLLSLFLVSLLAACGSDTIEGNPDYFKQGTFSVDVDGQKLYFRPVAEGSKDVLVTWNRIDMAYVTNDMTDTYGYHYSGNVSVPATVQHDGETYRVTGVDELAFAYSINLTGLALAEGITTIGDNAFVGIKNKLATFSLPSSLAMTTLPAKFFMNYKALTTATLPNVTAIADSTFFGCSVLTQVTIPETVNSLGKEAFSGCTRMTAYTLPASLQTIAEDCFKNNLIRTMHVKAVTPPTMASPIATAMIATLYVPKGSKTAYQNAENWKDFANIIEE